MVLAAPFEKLSIEFEGIEFASPVIPRPFVSCYVTHVEAVGINPLFFNLSSTFEMPDSILTTPESTLPFTIIGIGMPSHSP